MSKSKFFLSSQNIYKKVQFVGSPERIYFDRDADLYILADSLVHRIGNDEIIHGKYQISDEITNKDDYRKSLEYVEELSDRVVQHYGEKMNAAFDLKISCAQWNIIIGQWLESLICDIYFRYCKIKSIEYESLYLFRNADMKQTIMKDQKEFGMLQSYSTEFQSSIYGRIFEYLNMPVRDRRYTKKENRERRKKNRKINWAYRLKRFRGNPGQYIKRIFHTPKVNSADSSDLTSEIPVKAEVMVVKSRMPKDLEMEIHEDSNKRIGFMDDESYRLEMLRIIKPDAINYHARKETFYGFNANNEFEDMIDRILIDFLPLSFFESFVKLYNKAISLTENWKFKKIYHSAVYNELFLICMSIAHRNKTKILDIQHSAVYGRNNLLGSREYKTWDGFITWGWENSDPKFNNIRPVTMSRLPVAPKKKIKKRKKILMTINAPELDRSGRGWTYSNYVDNEMKFISTLSKKERHKLVIRTPADEILSDLENQCKKKYPEVRFEYIWEKSFVDSVMESEMLVSDYYGSSHLEALFLGCPFVMFDACQIINENPSIISYLNDFKKYGIYNKSPEEMAKTISGHKNYESWLGTPEIKHLMNSYLRTMANPRKIKQMWIDEMMGDI